jgi:hypothetical protein
VEILTNLKVKHYSEGKLKEIGDAKQNLIMVVMNSVLVFEELEGFNLTKL